MVEITALLLFVISFIVISFEEKLKTNKSAIALTIGGFLWLLVVVSGKSKDVIQQAASETGNEIFGIIMFLLASMVLVEIMSEHHLFEAIKNKLLGLNIDTKKQFLLLSVASFFLSAGLDNMTVGLVMIQVARQFFKGKNLLIAAAGVVIGANSGGSWSPIGDVTTVLLWIAGKYNTFTVIKEGFFPAFTFLLVSLGLLVIQIRPEEIIEHVTQPLTNLTKKDIFVICGSLGSFILPVLANAVGLPPYIGLVFGLGLVWLFLELVAKENEENIMEKIFKRLDLLSINFYVGILLAASALYVLGVLQWLSTLLFGASQEFFRAVWGSIGAGLLFATFDNIPLTALSIKLITLHQESLWVLLALTIGNGGSILLIGSAAGIAVMSGLSELSVTKYFKIAFLPTFLAYAAMAGVWFAEYYLFLR